MTTKPTPQVPALDGVTPLGIKPDAVAAAEMDYAERAIAAEQTRTVPRTKDERPDEIAVRAAKASEAGEHREAERLYLTAAARASAYTNQPTMRKNMQHWDKCASRERRLAELIKK